MPACIMGLTGTDKICRIIHIHIDVDLNPYKFESFFRIYFFSVSVITRNSFYSYIYQTCLPLNIPNLLTTNRNHQLSIPLKISKVILKVNLPDLKNAECQSSIRLPSTMRKLKVRQRQNSQTSTWSCYIHLSIDCIKHTKKYQVMSSTISQCYKD